MSKTDDDAFDLNGTYRDFIEHKKKTASETKCTVCGKQFGFWDAEMGNNRIDILIGYPSRHDLERLRMNLCAGCFDSLIDMIIPMCRENPIAESDWSSGCSQENYTIDPDLGTGMTPDEELGLESLEENRGNGTKRIPRMMGKICRLWMDSPEMSFGQIVSALFSSAEGKRDLMDTDDETLEEELNREIRRDSAACRKK